MAFHMNSHCTKNDRDKYQGDLPKDQVEKKMSELNQAYEVLSNEELKTRFDNGDDPNVRVVYVVCVMDWVFMVFVCGRINRVGLEAGIRLLGSRVGSLVARRLVVVVSGSNFNKKKHNFFFYYV